MREGGSGAAGGCCGVGAKVMCDALGGGGCLRKSLLLATFVASTVSLRGLHTRAVNSRTSLAEGPPMENT